MPQPQPSAYSECRHILTSGRKCHSPALRGRPFCFHHGRQRNLLGCNQRSINSVELPSLEDQSSILLAINQVIFALTHGRITDKMASRLLYAIQLAQNSINRAQAPDSADLVTDYLDGRHGDIVAPAEPGAESTEHDPPLLSEYDKSHSGHGDTCWEPTNADYPGHPEQAATHAVETAGQQPAEQEPTPPEPKSGPQKSQPQKSQPQKSEPWNHPLLDHIVHQLESGMSEQEIAAQLLSGNLLALEHTAAPS